MRGHCQICERLTVLKSNSTTLSHGGNPPCKGAHQLPIQLDTSLADKITSFTIANPHSDSSQPVARWIVITASDPHWEHAHLNKQRWINEHHNQPLIAGGGNSLAYNFERVEFKIKTHTDDRQEVQAYALMLNQARQSLNTARITLPDR